MATNICWLQSNAGHVTELLHDFESDISSLLRTGAMDFLVVGAENGFSPLGQVVGLLAREAGLAPRELVDIADWNRFENREVSLVVLPARTSTGFKGAILAPSETSESYKKFAEPRHSKPYRNFYYNVTYEALSHAACSLGARDIGITHLSASGHFHEDIATCTAEALAHFCDGCAEPKIRSLCFCGCCIRPAHFQGIARLNREGDSSSHRPIVTREWRVNGFQVISIDIERLPA